jgi:hypothetical protein
LGSVFKCISWLNGSFLVGNDRDFLKEGVKTAIDPEDCFANVHDFFRLLEDRLGQYSNGTKVVF